MAKLTEFDTTEFASKLDWAMPFQRTGAFPLDRSSMFKSLEDATVYATGGSDGRGLGGTSYPGQIIVVDTGSTVTAYLIKAGTFSGDKEDKSSRTLVELATTIATGNAATDISTLSGKVEALETWSTTISGEIGLSVNAAKTELTGTISTISTEISNALTSEVEARTTAVENLCTALSGEIGSAATTAHNELTAISSDLDAKISQLSSGIENLDATVSCAPAGDADGATVVVVQEDGKLKSVTATVKVTNEIEAAIEGLSTSLSNEVANKYVTKAALAEEVVTAKLSATSISADNLSVSNATFDAATATFGIVDATEIDVDQLSVSSGDDLYIGLSTFNDIIDTKATGAINTAITGLTSEAKATGTPSKGGAFAILSVGQTAGKLTGTAATAELEVVSNKVTSITDSVSDNAYPTAKAVSAYVKEEIKDLAGAMHFLGTVATEPAEGTTTVTINGTSVTPKAGDFIIVTGSAKEFVFNGTKWVELGDEVNHSSKGYTGEGTVTFDSSLTSTTLAGAINETKAKVDSYETSLTTGDLTATNISSDNLSVTNAVFDATTASITTLEAQSLSAKNLSVEALSTMYAEGKSFETIFNEKVTSKIEALDATKTNADKSLTTTGNDGISVTVNQENGLITGISAAVKVAGAIKTAVDALSTASDDKYVTKTALAEEVVTAKLTATEISASSLSVEDAQLNIVEAEITTLDVTTINADTINSGELSVASAEDIKIGGTTLEARLSAIEDMLAWYGPDDEKL